MRLILLISFLVSPVQQCSDRDSCQQLWFLRFVVAEEPGGSFHGKLHQSVWSQLWASVTESALYSKKHAL